MELRKFIATTIREFVNEAKSNSGYITEEIVAYHRSPKKFNKFNISNISNNNNRQLSGWGLYFSNIIPSKEYGEYLYKVNLFKYKKGYVLIDIKSPVQENIVNKIVEALDRLNKKSDEVIEFAYSGYLFYKTFLLSCEVVLIHLLFSFLLLLIFHGEY